MNKLCLPGIDVRTSGPLIFQVLESAYMFRRILSAVCHHTTEFNNDFLSEEVCEKCKKVQDVLNIDR